MASDDALPIGARPGIVGRFGRPHSLPSFRLMPGATRRYCPEAIAGRYPVYRIDLS